MLNRLERPTDPYDPAWVEYRLQNPGLRLSLSAASGDEGDDFDLQAFLPEEFHGDDGKYDTQGFLDRFNDLTTFKSQADEAKAALPEGPDGYEFALPEDFALPEGFDADAFKHTDDDGNEVEFDPASMVDAEDPDIPVLQGLMHSLAQGEVTPMDATKKLAGMLATRTLRDMQEAMTEAAEQKQALGPEGKARIATMKRTLAAKLPEAQAVAVLDSVTSADTLRGLESLIKQAGTKVPPAPGGKSHGEMSIDERLSYGLSQRAKGA